MIVQKSLEVAKENNIPLIIYSTTDLALEVCADGVHLYRSELISFRISMTKFIEILKETQI